MGVGRSRPQNAVRQKLEAVVAKPANLELDFFFPQRSGEITGVGHVQFNTGQALDIPALNTYKVGVPTLRIINSRHLKTPCVVSEVGAPEQTSLGKIDEISINCGLINTNRLDVIYEIAVGERPCGPE